MKFLSDCKVKINVKIFLTVHLYVTQLDSQRRNCIYFYVGLLCIAACTGIVLYVLQYNVLHAGWKATLSHACLIILHLRSYETI